VDEKMEEANQIFLADKLIESRALVIVVGI